MKRILITGAGSFVGTAVEKWLKKYEPDYTVDTLDVRGDEWRKFSMEGYDVIFHVAGIAHVDPKPEMAPLYYKVNTDLTKEIAEVAKKAHVSQFIFMSSMIVYHASKSLTPTVIDKETTPKPNDFYGDSKLKAEIALNALKDKNFKVAILRPCMIYGPDGKGNFQRLEKLALSTPIFPNWHNSRSMLFIDNLCEFVRQTIVRDLEGIFPLQNREFADTVEIVKFYAQNAKHPIWISKIFNPFVKVGAKILSPVSKMFADQYYTPDTTTYNFDYQIVSLQDSLRIMAQRN